MRHESFDIGSIDVRSLNPAQRKALQRHLIRQAQAARTQAIQRSLAPVSMLLRRLRPALAVQAIRHVIGKVRTAHTRRRDRREELASLHAMTDHELHDIGLARSQISAVATSDETDAASQDRTL